MPAATTDPLVRLTAVTKVYRMGDVEVQALRGVSLQIAQGGLTAIMGASGSGKSTLMNLSLIHISNRGAASGHKRTRADLTRRHDGGMRMLVTHEYFCCVT